MITCHLYSIVPFLLMFPPHTLQCLVFFCSHEHVLATGTCQASGRRDFLREKNFTSGSLQPTARAGKLSCMLHIQQQFKQKKLQHMEMRNLNIFLITRCAPIILKADTSLAAGVSCILSLFEDMTPDICQFWDTTAAKQAKIGQNFAFPIYAKKYTDLN